MTQYYAATTGNDSNAGTSVGAPWRTFGKAHTAMSSGDVCNFADGTYTAFLNLSKDGLTFQATNPRGVITKSVDIEGDNNVWRGFVCSDVTANAPIRTFGDNNIVDNCEIHDSLQDGIWFWGNGTRFIDCYIHDIYDPSLPQFPTYDEHVDGFQTFSWSPYNCTNITIERCLIYHDRPNGSNQMLILTHSAGIGTFSNITIKNCIWITEDSGYMPIALYGDSGITGVKIYNNTFYAPNGATNPIYLVNMPQVHIANNAAIDYTGAIFARSGGTAPLEQTNDITAPFGMTDIPGHDFSLLSSSNLIKVGTAGLGVTDDFDGNPRSGNPDIGAFEYQGSASSGALFGRLVELGLLQGRLVR